MSALKSSPASRRARWSVRPAVQRLRDGDHGRDGLAGSRRCSTRVTVTITDAGRALLAKVLPGHAEVISHLLFQPLSRKDAKALADLLAPVRDHMRAAPPRSAAPRTPRR